MSNNWITIATFTYESEILILLSKLENEGIRYVTQNREFIGIRPMLSNAVGGIKVLVHKEDVEQSLGILKNFEDKLSLKPKLDVIFKDIRYKRVHGFCLQCDEDSVYKEKTGLVNRILNLLFIRKRKYYCNSCKHTWENYF